MSLAGLEMERIKKTHLGVAEEGNQEGTSSLSTREETIT